MDTLSPGSLLWSPFTFALLIAFAVLLFWRALAPARRETPVDRRLNDYVEREDVVQAAELSRPLAARTLLPMLYRLLYFLGGFMPKRNLERTAQMLVQAGEPGKITVLDFLGMRLLLALLLGGFYFFFFAQSLPTFVALRNIMVAFSLGLLLPQLWLRRRARERQNAIRRALPDALDMLTIGVEAGLAFESALLRVGEQWQNALTQETRRVVAEMRVGSGRNEALQRMVARTAVEELSTFVAILIQSNQLGVSIAQVLHTQAAQMRIKRRQRAEETARQASVKIVVVLVFFVFPALYIVILGPQVPQMLDTLRSLAGNVGQ